MQDSLRMKVLQDLSILISSDDDHINEISILDCHDLSLKVHEDDILGVTIDAEFAFGIVHHVIDSERFLLKDLLSLKVDFNAPEDETLFVFFGLFKKDIDYVIYGLGDVV